ncbi:MULTISPECIES: chloride channel protein [Hymenobacter]|uniref:Chloride channel protein n=1 Tax=Hymenobacter jejuensis TaxID=2502781 RepID=A0A5B7ZYD8_9BACT|nr:MULTISPECIES: chloride channel protein [Hymenobacter]MBC6991890.1 chloride channel protein [Hymenobacter sp. BT491]QDA60204.1 chloride channel protein [Hymenobacter jejuensis]
MIVPDSRIPIATSLVPALEAENIHPKRVRDKQRLLRISALAVAIAFVISFVAKGLVYLINWVSNLAFYGESSVQYHSPAGNHLGAFVIVLPAIGGIIVGLMALYGSKAIRGHGIPEAMEQVLTNKSRIKPIVMFLKPLSAAISIGTGGPFGAEGPIIATGGAFGSSIGQALKITHTERKILLAAGATAGMSAIFGTPIAAIFLAIELLLFEFSPRSILPVALACITGAAGHHLLFESGPAFGMPLLDTPSNIALATYSFIGLVVGLASVAVTKLVYFIEDQFEHLPIHWMWWPALGGLAVGVVGYFAPRTLGVGYENITDLLSGNLTLQVVLSLCFLKFVSWAISLGSGTSGGTLAPLLTIGGATGALLGGVILRFFPGSEIVVPMAALVGMAAMFAGASRALLTSIVFAVEATGQSHALLPLLGACTGSYFVSFFLMDNTIMTEKIARRGVKTPDSYEPDMLEKIRVGQVLREGSLTISADNTIEEVCQWLEQEPTRADNYFVIVDNEGEFKGIVSFADLYGKVQDRQAPIHTLISHKPTSVLDTDSLRTAVATMARANVDVLPVVVAENRKKVAGVLSYKDIIASYKYRLDEDELAQADISVKRRSIKILLRGQKLLKVTKGRS